MSNPIPSSVRGWLFAAGAVLGIFSAVTGPLIIALNISDEWAAVIVSAVGAITSALSLLARANLSTDEEIPYAIIDESDADEDEGEPAEYVESDAVAGDDSIKANLPTGKHSLTSEDGEE